MKIKKILIIILVFLFQVFIFGCNQEKTTINNTNISSSTLSTTSTHNTTSTNGPTSNTTSINSVSSLTQTSKTKDVVELIPTSSSVQVRNYYKDFDFDIANLSKAQLIERIYDLISVCDISISYIDTRDYFQYTDPGKSPGTVQLFYTHLEVETRASDGRLVLGSRSGEYNREHVWPQSLGDSKDEPGGHDLHHIRPTLCDLNSARGDLVYGNVEHKSTNEVKYQNVIYAYKTSKVFEPKDDVKGDVARIVFYYSIKYNYDLSIIVDDKTYSDILEWNRLDPVSEIEITRNNVVEGYQHNRNIFVDYPELADYIWG